MLQTIVAIVSEYVFEHVFDQFHYIGWPDFGAPTTTDSIIVLAKAVRKIVAQKKQNNVKVLKVSTTREIPSQCDK